MDEEIQEKVIEEVAEEKSEIEVFEEDLKMLQSELDTWLKSKDALTMKLNEAIMNINRLDGAIAYIRGKILNLKTKKE